MSNQVNSKEDLLNVVEEICREYTIKRWDKTVNIRILSGKQLNRIQDEIMKHRKADGTITDMSGIKRLTLQLGLCDSKGVPLFGDSKSVDALEEKSGAVINELFTAICDANGMSDEGKAALGKG